MQDSNLHPRLYPAGILFRCTNEARDYQQSCDQISLVILLSHYTTMISRDIKLGDRDGDRTHLNLLDRQVVSPETYTAININYEVSESAHRFERLSNHSSIHIPTL